MINNVCIFQRTQTNKNTDGNVSDVLDIQETKNKNTPQPGTAFPSDGKRVSYSPHMSRYSPSKQHQKISNGGYSNATSAVSSRTVLQALGMKVNDYDHYKVPTKIIRLMKLSMYILHQSMSFRLAIEFWSTKLSLEH